MQVYLVNLLYIAPFSVLLFLPPLGHTYSTVIEVIDGDTVLTKYQGKVRLVGIDAPEINQKSFDKKNIGKISKRWLRKRLLNKKVLMRLYGRGYYKRLLGEIFLKNKSINKEIVRVGMAVSYGKKFRFEEMIAQKKRVGIWSTLGFYRPRVFRKITKRYLNRD